MKIYSAQLKGTTTVATGSNVSLTGSFTGSIYGFNDTLQYSSSVDSRIVVNTNRLNNIESTTASFSPRVSNLESKSSSVDISISNINSFTASNGNTSLNQLTGSLATTGSNTFKGTTIISGSTFIQGDFVVFGSSSIQYISASSVSIGTNIVQLNTANPAVRFGGLAVQDSGSAQGVTGSMLWDSCCNRWIYSNPSGIGYSGGIIMSGPRASTLGSETPLTCNYIAKSGGGDHLYDSCTIDDGTTTCIKNNLVGTGTACFADTVCALRFLWSSGTTESFLTTGGGNTAIGNGGSSGLTLYSSNTPRLCISTTGISTFTCRVCSNGLSTNASIVLNESAPISFSGTGGYISMYSRTAGTGCGAILFNNGTGQNLWFGEVAAHVYGFSTGGAGTTYSGTPLLNLDVINQKVGIGIVYPSAKLDIAPPSSNTQGGCFSASSINISDPTTVGAYSQITFGYPSGRIWASSYIGHISNDSYSGGYGDLVFGTRNCGNDIQPSERLRITSNGNVGIGCSTPNTPLYVVGEITSQNGEMYFKRSTFCDYGHIYMGSDKNFYIRQTAACTMIISVGGSEKMRINSGNSIVGYSQWYTTYVKATCTPDGGSQNVRYIEDSLGQWLLVGRFINNASITLSSCWSSVRGLSTSLAQDAATEFSADWGNSCPTEIRIMGATDFCRWRETRTVDFIYKNIPGRAWSTFFNGGCDNGTYTTLGTPRLGFNTCGTYDGFGRWSNPFNCMIGMSDAAYTNPSTAYATPTTNAFYWFTAQDAKLTAIHSGIYSGQDATETTGFGYDDSVRGFVDAYPNFASNMSGGDQLASAVWILLKFN